MKSICFDKEKFYFQWHITHKCNLRCKHCYQDDYCGHMQRDDLFDCLDKFESFVAHKRVLPQINLTGGEPLIHPDFFDLACEIRDRGIMLSVLTNGTLIDDETAYKLKQLSPLFVQVSLDGTQKSHDFVRGEGSFEKALCGIDNLKKHGIRVLVSFTAQKNNISDFPGLARVCKKHGVDKLWWDRVVTYSKEEHETLALSSGEFKKAVKTARRLEWLYGVFGNRFISNQRALQFSEKNNEGYVCNAGKNLVVVLADGSVMPCRRLPFVIGNIKQSDFYDIVNNSEVVKELLLPRIPDGCEGCKDYYRCRGGAKCITYARTGRLNARDIDCYR